MRVTINGEQLDLYVYDDISIDEQIQVSENLNERIVPSTPTISIPKTENNKNIIEPLITSTNKIENVELYFENGTTMLAVMYVNTSSMYVFGEEYSVRFVSVLADNIKKIQKDKIGDLFTPTDDWGYMFEDDSSLTVPSIDPTNKWFLAAPNRNGFDYTNGTYPIYSERYISDEIGDVYIGMSIYSFLYETFTKYSIPIGFSKTDILLNGITLGDACVFFPVNFKTLDDRSMEFDVITATQPDGSVSAEIQNITKDSLEQASLQSNKITATTDTYYNVSIVSNGTQVTIRHFEIDIGQGAPPDTVSGIIKVQLLVLKDDAIVRAIDIATFDFDNGTGYDSLGNATVNVNQSFDGIVDMKLLATSEITFKVVTKFINYSFTDNYCGETITLNYTTGGFPSNIYTYFGCNNPAGDKVEYELSLSDQISFHINMDSVENIKACSRITNNVSKIETVSMTETLNDTNIKIADVISEILKRFNAGFYMKNGNTIGISTFGNRYTGTFPIEINTWDDGYIINYINNTLGDFSYTNKVLDVKDKTYKDRDGKKHMLGDVVKQNYGGDRDEALSLTSCIVFDEMYSGDYQEVTSDDYDMIIMKDDNGDIYGREYFGVPYNKKAGEKSGDVLFGFVSTNSSSWILMPHVLMFARDKDDQSTRLPTVAYIKDANSSSTSLPGTLLSIPKPTDLFSGSSVLKLGGDLTHEVDESSLLYINFKTVLEPSSKYIEVKTVMDWTGIYLLLSGNGITINHYDGTTKEYYPIEIDGIMAEQKNSVVKIKLVE